MLHQLRQVARERMGDVTVWRSDMPAREVWLVKTGIGVQRAEAAATRVTDVGGFGLFVSTGCAGALAPELAPGHLTIATAIVDSSSGRRFEADANQHQRARRAAERAALRTTAAAVLCSAQMLATATAKRAAAAQSGAVAVEMEGAPIAACAARAGVPFVSVRAILDTAATELRHGGKFIDQENGTLKPLALAGYLATHPRVLPDLLALQRMRNAVQASLDKFFSAWFAEP